MSLRRLGQLLRRRRAWACEVSGSGQEFVEFALVLPVILILLFFGVEVVNLVRIQGLLEDCAAKVASDSTLCVATSPEELHMQLHELAVEDEFGPVATFKATLGKELYAAGTNARGHVVFDESSGCEISVSRVAQAGAADSSYEYKMGDGSVRAPLSLARVQVQMSATVRWLTPLGPLLSLMYGHDPTEGQALSSRQYNVICDISSARDWEVAS